MSITLKYGSIATASRARSSNVATIITNGNHRFQSGHVLTLSGLGGTGYNQTDVSITVTGANSFTYANTGSNEGTTADTGGTVVASKTFEELHLKGFDDPDNADAINYVMNQSDDGGLYPYDEGFRRRITVHLNVELVKANRVFLFFFWRDKTTQTLSYGSESNLAVVFENGNNFSSTWLEEIETQKEFTFVFLEKSPRTTVPSTWL